MGLKKKFLLQHIVAEDYAAEGRCLARVEGKVIFIENAVPGDVADVFIRKNKKDWAEGIARNFHSLSDLRVKPFCSHFGICGGCKWQMLPYNKQLEFKQREVEENLKRIGKIKLPAVRPIIGSENDKFYRNKLEYTFSNKRFLAEEELKDPSVSPGQNVAGFHAKGVYDKVVDIDTCYLQPEPTNALRKWVKQFAVENQFEFYDIKQHTGFLRTMQVRTSTAGEVMVNIVFKYESEEIHHMLKELVNSFPSVTTVLYTINPKLNDSLQDLEPVVFHGKGYILEKLEDFIFKISPESFFQTNTKQAERLYKVTRDFSRLTGNETVYDLYCGTGSIGIFLSRQAKKIIGVEVINEAIADAKENAALNGVEHASFFAGDVAEICTNDFFEAHGRPDVIIADPPRAGMHEKLLNKLLEMEAPRVVYVSCNSATQARDLHRLDEKYEVVNVQPVDMFPHTHHIENVVELVLK